jgi:hypothetical protein
MDNPSPRIYGAPWGDIELSNHRCHRSIEILSGASLRFTWLLSASSGWLKKATVPIMNCIELLADPL